MWDDLEIKVTKVGESERRQKPDQANLAFGRNFTDHMFLMKWSSEEGWHDAEICPYQDFHLDPAAMVFHYGQAIFEGMKAYRGKTNDIFLFRPRDNFARMSLSAQRLCMPHLAEEKVLSGLRALLYLDQDWVPSVPGASLYIRPFMIATEPMLGVKPSASYYFAIIMCPVGAYYAEGFNPTKIFVSEKYARAVPGGVGEAKAAGNYAASLLASEEAKKEGYTQVLWLDACERRYIEEVGTSNIFFCINDELVTPKLGGSILSGLTRNSVLTLAHDWDMKVSERRITIDELLQGCKDGSVQEAFATGTAAVISPVGELCYKGEKCLINGGKTGKMAKKFFDELQMIQFGEKKDLHNWSMKAW